MREFLKEEYRYLADSFWKNEQSGETRLSFFIGLVGTALAALAAIDKVGGPEPTYPLRWIALGSLLCLKALGVLSFFRILARNEAADRYKRALDAVRQTWKDEAGPGGLLYAYNPFPPVRGERLKDGTDAQSGTAAGARKAHRGRKRPELRKLGGIAHSIALMNSLLAGCAVWLALADESPIVPAIVVCAVFLSAYILYAASREASFQERLRRPGITHAGAVVERSNGPRTEYLLIRDNRDRDWVLPSGHVEEGEGHAEAAVREVMEETGYAVVPLAWLGQSSYMRRGERAREKYYLMEFAYETHGGEGRKRIWLPLSEAIATATYEEARWALLLASAKSPLKRRH